MAEHAARLCGATIIGTVPVADADTAAIHKILAPIWTTTPETASRLRGRIEAVLDQAKVLGYRTGENSARWHWRWCTRVRKAACMPKDARRTEYETTIRQL